MLFTEVIRNKRDMNGLSRDEIEYFVQGLANNSLPAEQVSALAMAIFLNGMTHIETGQLTSAMASSGTIVDWSDTELRGPLVDKHSTGGVGDKVSFLLAPIAAACGCYVPMISGRGLGHTGGTLDKVDAIPGYRSNPDLDSLKRIVKADGCAIIGQTDDIAPADRRLYSIRDITGTVESIPLITASILSKKIAAGNEALVMDIKCGTGAFMDTLEKAETLSRSIIQAAESIGLKTHAIITDMSEVLGDAAGNALEISESVAFLKNERRETRLNTVTLNLTGEMLFATGLVDSREEGIKKCDTAVSSGKAAEIFGRMVTSLGGPADFMERTDIYLESAPVVKPILAPRAGYLRKMDTRSIGNAIVSLGGGREKAEQKLDLAVGFSDTGKIGAWFEAGDPVCMVHARSDASANQAIKSYLDACQFGDEKPTPPPTISATLSAANFRDK